MSSARFKKIFFVRFISYFAIIIGILVTLSEFGPIAQAEFGYRIDNLVGKKYKLSPIIINSAGTTVQEATNSSLITDNPDQSGGPGFGSVNSSGSDFIKPVSTDYGIVIEKINANAKVIAQVDPTDEAAYVKALMEGVAEAKGSTEPGKAGNTFMFSHSTDAPWNIVRFNAIFYLLREVAVGDRIIVFYQGRRYDYIVFDKTITDPTDVTFLTNRYDRPVLTLQTCDPPGTLLHRLIVRAKLAGT